MTTLVYVCAMSVLSAGRLWLGSQTMGTLSLEEKTPPVHLSMIQMANGRTGWGEIDAGSHTEILSTNDGGVRWKVAVKVSSYSPIELGNSGAAWYATETSGRTPYARVHFTKDWGRHWSVSNPLRLPSGRSDRLQLSFAAGQKDGWMTVSAGGMNSAQTLQVWNTNDGGAKWNLRSNANPTDFLLGFQNSLAGWAECSHAGSPVAAALAPPKSSQSTSLQPALYRTVDGGRTWQPQYLPVPANLVAHAGLASLTNMTWFGRTGFMECSFASDRLPYEKWGLYSTTDGGVHWSLHIVNGVSNNYGDHMHDVTFDIAGPKDLWETITQVSATLNGPYRSNYTMLYHSEGINQPWKEVGKTPVPLSDVQFVSPRMGFGLTSTGALYRTTDGGRIWRLT